MASLTLPQLEQLLARAEADLSHYAKLLERMREVGLEDRMVRQVERTHAELQAWRMMLHYAVVSRKRQEDGWSA